MHHTVNYGAGEYVRAYSLHTNSIKSVWAILNRQIVGIHHWVSPKLQHAYPSAIDLPLDFAAKGPNSYAKRGVTMSAAYIETTDGGRPIHAYS